MPATPRSDENSHILRDDKEFISNSDFLIDIPPHLPQCRQLHTPLAPEVFCSYRPTLMEYHRLLNIIHPSVLGPPVELLAAADVFKVESDPSKRRLHPDDAALIVGEVQGVERFLKPETSGTLAPILVEPAAAAAPQAKGLPFVHPLKPELKPSRIFQLKPHEDLHARTLVPASIVEYQPHRATTRLLLKRVGEISERILTFAAYSGDVKRGEDARFKYMKDHIVRMADSTHQARQNYTLLLRLPAAEEAEEETAYFARVQPGGKLVFSRNSTTERTGVQLELKVAAAAAAAAAPPND